MGRFRAWLAGFAWGALIGAGLAAFVGLSVFRPDLISKLEDRVSGLARPGGTGSDVVRPPASVPAAAPAPAAAVAESGRWFAGARTSAALDQEFRPPARWSADDDLVIRGRNPGAAPTEVNIRIDDANSKDWFSRFGDLTQVAAGAPFELRVPLNGLETPGKGRLDRNAIIRFVVFTPPGQPAADITAVTLERRAAGNPGAVPQNEARPGQSWLRGAVTTAVQEFRQPASFEADQELVVAGTNTSSKPVTVYLRIDDVNSKDWFSRGNTTTTVPPGPFTVRSPVASWVTPSKARLDRTKIRRLVISVGDDDKPVTLNEVRVESGSPVPPDALALRFAPTPDIAVPGFETVLPDDPRLAGTPGKLIRTPNDPLLSSAINGIRRVTVPWTRSATATVSLWTEDQGEWEYFPHSLNRTFTINGIRVHAESYQPSQWIREVYLRGLWQEAMIDGDPWEVYARRRAGLVTATVPVVDGKIVVDIDSDQPPNNGYLAAMVIEPGDSRAAVNAIEAWRRARYAERWPVVDRKVDPALAKGLALKVIPQGRPRSQHPFWDDGLPTTLRLRAPRGGIVSVDFLALSDTADSQPVVKLDLPSGVVGEVRWGKWTFMRRGVGENSLGITADVLEGDLSRLRIGAAVPRRFTVTLNVPAEASGDIPVKLTLMAGGRTAEASATVEVIKLALPDTQTPVGFYMAAPNYDVWFKPPPAEADRLMACDYRALRRFGITGIAPDMVIPTPERRDRYVEQMRLVREAGFAAPYFDYPSVKFLVQDLGTEAMGRAVAGVERALKVAGIPAPLWSITDEPSILATPHADLGRIRDAIRIQAPEAKISGQLNSPKDKPLLDLFTAVLVNYGYGVNADEFARMKAMNVTPWLYNMPDMEVAAGFLLWRVGAGGYLQWHARAATADPADPTDGREPDFLMLPFSADRCQSVPTVDAQVIAVGDGIQDLRWLQWLDGRAATDPAAKTLREQILTAIPADWEAYDKAKPSLPALRGKILDYAQSVAAQGGQ